MEFVYKKDCSRKRTMIKYKQKNINSDKCLVVIFMEKREFMLGENESSKNR